MLGDFGSIPTIQALTGTLLSAIPSSSSESLSSFGVSLYQSNYASYSRENSPNPIRRIPRLHFQRKDTLRDRLRVDVPAIWYGLHVLLDYMLVYTPRSGCGIHFDRPPVPPRSG